MIHKLAKNAKKGRWEGKNLQSESGKLIDEVKELEEAIAKGNMVEILLEAADVANFALIISAIAMERGQ